MDSTETLLSIFVGIGLSAACGFRIFIPLLITSLAAKSGHLTLAEGFDWIASTPAVVTFSIATVLEVTAYYVPWLDNALDSVATPAAVIAGTIITASMVSDVSPYLQWSLAVIAGGGVAGAVQGMTVLARGASTAATGGLANPVVATAEMGGSLVLGGLSTVAPIAAVILIPCMLGVVGYKIYNRKANRQPPVIEPSS